jgi:transcriptional regulator with XRE-family HTH domain
MPDSFGARLRQRREERGIALVTIAQQTKIKTSLLEELERDDVSHWPSGIYRRAFFRAYARAIDLDSDALMQEFVERHPEPEVDVLAAMASALERGDGHSRTAAGLRDAVGSAFATLARRRRTPVDDETRGASTVVVPPGVPTTKAEQPSAPEIPPVVAPPVPAPPAMSEPLVAFESAPEPDLLAIARLCTDIGRAENPSDVQPLLQEVATLLDATGLIVWLWDSAVARLKAALVHGYPAGVVARLPMVARDAHNATAAAFRSAEMRTISDSQSCTSALVLPLMTSAGCAGVLAIELQPGKEQTKSMVALATILAAQLAHLGAIGLQADELPPARLAVGGVTFV